MRKNQYQTRKKRKFPLKIILFGGLFFCLLGGLAYFSIWSNFLWVKEIEIKLVQEPKYYLPEQIEEIIQGELKEKLWSFIPQKSIFLIPIKNIKENILNRFPEIKSVEINKRIPDSLEVVILERESVGIWCQIKKCFNIDNEGVIFKESPLVSGSFILNIYASSSQPVEIRDQVTTSRVVEFILITNEELSEIKTTDDLSLSPIDFEIVSEENLRVKINSGFEIYFNPSCSVDSQLKMLKMVLTEQIKDEELTSLIYIDLRIQGRAYYK